MSNKWKFFWVVSFVFVVFFQACGSWEEIFISLADEKKMGREFDSLIRIGDPQVIEAGKGDKLLEPSTAAEIEFWNYYQERGKQIVGKIDDKNFKDLLPGSEKLCRNGVTNSITNAKDKVTCNKNNFFEFNIIKSKTVNAFAVPGGYVYFYTAILKDFKSESELMSVLGHEVGHVVQHHSRERMLKSSAASTLISIFLGDGIAGLIGLLGANFWLLSNSRENELEADEMGYYYTNAIGISSKGLSDFFGRGLKSYNSATGTCNEGKESSVLDVFSTHPPSCERVVRNNDRMKGQNFDVDKNFVHGKSFKTLFDETGL